jgi:anti-anti-sigma factor
VRRAQLQLPAPFDVRVVVGRTTRTLSVLGELDVASEGALCAAIDAAMADAPETVVLDLSEAQFLDSAAVRCVHRAHVEAGARSVRLEVVAAPGPVHRVFALCDVDPALFRAGPPHALPGEPSRQPALAG